MNLSSSFVQVARIALWAFIAAVAGFTVVGVVAFIKTETGQAKSFTLLFKRGDFLKLLAVAGIVMAVFFLALAGVLSEAAVVAVLSGIAGYVLGGLEKSAFGSQKPEDENVD